MVIEPSATRKEETVMGNLVTETPYSEVTATLELLDRLGVDREGLKKFRKAASYLQFQVARLIQGGEDVARKWREENGVIYFSVTSDGTSGPDWITRLESKGFRVSDWAKSVLRSSDFKPTSGITTEIAVLKGMLFGDDDRVAKKIRAEAKKRGLTKPNAEAACLIREMFSDKELEAMGLRWIVVMHEPIDSGGDDPFLLHVDRGDGGRWLLALWDGPGSGWYRVGGVAFVVSQVSP